MTQKNFINTSLLRKFFINLFFFAIITTIIINHLHKYYQNAIILNVEDISAYNEKINKNNENFKLTVSKSLASKDTYKIYLDRECKITGSMDDRKKVRWVFEILMYKAYNFLIKANVLFPYYFQILLISTLVFLSSAIIFKTFPVNNEYKYLFLFFIAFVFQNHLGEFRFSTFEMFFISSALFASKTKNFVLFLISVLLATLNRESGILISLTWFIFNNDFKKFIYTATITTLFYIFINFDIISCLTNPEFFVPGEYQYGQFNFSDIGKSISYLSAIKVILINFIIPFGVCFYIYYTTENKNKIIFYILLIYLLIFLFAIPAQHIAVRLLLLPFLIGLIYFKSKNIVHAKKI